MKQTRGPEFIRFLRPILEVLIESGGSGTASEIVDRSLELMKVSESEQEAVNKNGQSRVKNQVHWARQYLVWDGYLDSSKRGVWSLTDKGKSTSIRSMFWRYARAYRGDLPKRRMPRDQRFSRWMSR